ncbi:MAG TPA: tetratricopeptide repeat protein [Geothrix sp.]|nr:tetratricopeptide repeat protein [Geothrix sp.]
MRPNRILVPTLILAASLGLQADSFVRAAITVVDKDGNPVAGAKISLKRTDTGWKRDVTTDSHGVATMGTIPSSKEKVFQVLVEKDGFNATNEMTDFPLQTETSIKKKFTLYKPGESPVGAPASAPVSAAPAADDPAAQLDTDARKAFNELALPLVQAGKFDEAIPIMDKAYTDLNKAFPDIKDPAEKDEVEKTVLPSLEKTYGLALFQAGKKEEALPLLEKVIVREPKNKNILIALVQGYGAKKDKANEAKYQALLDAETGPRADLSYNKGVEAFNKTHYKEAREHLTKALEIDPNFADAHYLLGLVDANGGNMAGVKSHFHKYLELAPSGSHAAEVKEMLAGL